MKTVEALSMFNLTPQVELYRQRKSSSLVIMENRQMAPDRVRKLHQQSYTIKTKTKCKLKFLRSVLIFWMNTLCWAAPAYLVKAKNNQSLLHLNNQIPMFSNYKPRSSNRFRNNSTNPKSLKQKISLVNLIMLNLNPNLNNNKWILHHKTLQSRPYLKTLTMLTTSL